MASDSPSPQHAFILVVVFLTLSSPTSSQYSPTYWASADYSAVDSSTASSTSSNAASSSSANYLDDYLAASSILQEVAESLHSFDDRLLKQKEDLWNEFGAHERKEREKWTTLDGRLQRMERDVGAAKAAAAAARAAGASSSGNPRPLLGGGGAVVDDHLKRLIESSVERILARQSREVLSRLASVEQKLPFKVNRVEEELRKNEIGRWETELRMFSKKLMEMEQRGLGHGPTGWKTSMEDRIDQVDAKTVQNLQEWKRLENKVDNEDRNVKNDVNLLKKQAKDLEYGHQRLKGLMTNQRQKTQREADHGKRLQALDEKVTSNEIRIEDLAFNVNKTATAMIAAKYQSQQALKNLDAELKNVSFDVQNAQFDLRRVDLAVKSLEREKRKWEQQLRQRENLLQQDGVNDEPSTDHRGSSGGVEDVGASSAVAQQVVEDVDRKFRRFNRRIRDELTQISVNASEREMLQNERVQQQLLGARREFLSYVGDVQGVQTSQREAIDKLERKVEAAFKLASSGVGGIIEGLSRESGGGDADSDSCDAFRRCAAESDFIAAALKNSTKETARSLASEVLAEFRVKVDEKLDESMREDSAENVGIDRRLEEMEAGMGRRLEEAEERTERLVGAKVGKCEEKIEAVETSLEEKEEEWRRRLEEKADEVGNEMREWVEEERTRWKEEGRAEEGEKAQNADDEAGDTVDFDRFGEITTIFDEEFRNEFTQKYRRSNTPLGVGDFIRFMQALFTTHTFETSAESRVLTNLTKVMNQTQEDLFLVTNGTTQDILGIKMQLNSMKSSISELQFSDAVLENKMKDAKTSKKHCQVGNVNPPICPNGRTYGPEGVPCWPYRATVKFDPPFQEAPKVITAFRVLFKDKRFFAGIQAWSENYTRESVDIGIDVFQRVPIRSIKVVWVACG